MARNLRFLSSRRVELVVYLLLVLVIGLYTRGQVKAVDHRQTVHNCGEVEKLKAIFFVQAVTTIVGDRLLLDANRQTGAPLPVPRQAIEDDIAAKEVTKKLTAPQPCPD